MGQYAKVNSVAALKQLRSALAPFTQAASTALDEVSTEIQRTLAWLHEDRRRYWANQVRLRTEQYVQAKLALKRKGIFDISLTGHRSTAVDEKKALAIAERRLNEAKRRQARTQSWIMRIEKELSDYRAAVQGLSGMIDLDIPNARAKLEKMVESLEAYAALAPPEVARSTEDEQPESTVGTPGGPTTVFRTPVSDAEAQDQIALLRERTPSLEVRDQTEIGSDPVDWFAKIEPSEALRKAAQDIASDAPPPEPEQKVLVALPAETPDAIYLERSTDSEKDSGWYLGVADDTQTTEYAAIRIDALLGICPPLEDLLSLPAGHVVLISRAIDTEILFDAGGTVLWRRSENSESSSEEDETNPGA